MTHPAPRPTAVSRIICTILLLLAAALGFQSRAVSAQAQEKAELLSFENAMLSIRLSPRTPQQTAAFYEARGFPTNAVEVLKQSCFVTVRIHNRSNTVVWLELDNWRFVAETGEIQRLERAYWSSRWRGLALPQRNRSTFQWTLLPESRDLQPDEPVGGNITLPTSDQPFAVEARFAVGRHKRGQTQRLRINDVRCAGEDSPL